MHHTGKQAHGRHLRRGGKKGGDGSWRAFINVWRPHVKRCGRHFERHARDDKDQPQQQTHRQITALCRLHDARKFHGAGKAIDQRCTVKQQAGGQGPQHEVFQTRFRGFGAVTTEGGDHVKRQRLQLKAHIQCQQTARRDHHHHANHRQGNQ